jgi:hypothetical protein
MTAALQEVARSSLGNFHAGETPALRGASQRCRARLAIH